MTAEYRELPPQGSKEKTRLGTFSWEGPHFKWCCDGSKLGDGLDLMIDDYEITERALRKIERIYRFSFWLRRLALFKARKDLKENCARPSDMKFVGIGIIHDPLPEFCLDFKYPHHLWPDGELSVSFLFGLPFGVEQGG